MAVVYDSVAGVDPVQELLASPLSRDDWAARCNYMLGLGVPTAADNGPWQPFVSYALVPRALPILAAEEWLVRMFYTGTVEPERPYINEHSNTQLQEVWSWANDRQVPLATPLDRPGDWFVHIAADPLLNAETAVLAQGLIEVVNLLEIRQTLAVNTINTSLLDQLFTT